MKPAASGSATMRIMTQEWFISLCLLVGTVIIADAFFAMDSAL
jgi:predicted tellurium resistance membrane protein TerC